ncbi:MAG: hypothetical protein AAB972_05485 [Patescibacteria group bacterium]
MEDSLGVLMRRIRDKDPILTPQELEKQIADCVGTKINEAIKQTLANRYIALLQETIKDVFGLFCEIAPALSLYVNVSDTSDENISIEPFSSLPFEKSLAAILEKDFCALADEQIAELTEEVINEACKQFLDNVLLPHPLLTKISQRFEEVFHEQLAVQLRDPARMIINMGPPPQDATPPPVRPGMYL